VVPALARASMATQFMIPRMDAVKSNDMTVMNVSFETALGSVFCLFKAYFSGIMKHVHAIRCLYLPSDLPVRRNNLVYWLNWLSAIRVKFDTDLTSQL
jgi:uncharacterized protein with PQ loop repeat